MRLRKSYWLLPLLVLSFVFLLTAGIPNVSTGTWQTWNNLGDVRSGAAAVLLQDGRVLIIGGTNANGPVSSADLFGTDGVFSAATAMQTPRSGHTATVLSDGRVLVTGGTTSSGGAVNTAEIYDPNANSWSAQVATVDARSGHTASLLSDGRVLLAGGHDSAGNALSSLEIFDPTSGKFSSAGALSVPRMNHAASTLGDGRVLIIGGTADGTTALASIDIYDPSAGTVSTGPVLSTPRMSATATTTLGGKVAVIGGNNGAVSGSQDLASAEIFDPATGLLSPSASSLATARSGHQSFLLPKNNAILVVGGSSAGTDLSSAELYYPWLDSFQSTAAMSVARPGLAGSAVGLDGRFLTAGGTGLASTELYGFATVKTDAADYPPGSTVTISGGGWQPGETVTLTLRESPLIDSPPTMTAVADANGNISNNQFSPDIYDVNVRFYLTAVGQTSAFQAQNTFTDAPPNASITVTASPAAALGGSFSITRVQSSNGNTQTSGGTTPQTFGGTQPNSSFSVTTIQSPVNGCTYTGPGTVNGTTGAANTTTTVTLTYQCIARTTTAISAPTITYNANGSVTVTVTSTAGTVTGNVSLSVDGGTAVSKALASGSATFTNTDIAALTSPSAGDHTLSASYAAQGNFDTSSNTGNLHVNPAALTVTAGSYSGAYDASSHALSDCTVSANPDNLTCTNNPAGPVGPDVGSGTVTPVVSGSTSNYSVTTNNGSWSITALAVTLTGGSYGPAAYDGSTHAPSACSSSAPSFVTCSNSPSPVGPDFGSGAVSPTPVYGKGSAADYSITPNNGSWSITALAVTVTGGSYGPAVYDGNSHALSACASTYAGVTCTNNPAGPVGPEVTSTPQTVTPVSAIATGIAADYDIKPVNGSWSITPLGVSLTAGSYGPAAYDGSTHAPSACSSSAPSFVTCSNSPSPVGPDFGSGAVSPTPVYGKGSAADYSITPNNGSWSITALAVTVTGGSYSGVYDGSSHPLSACTSTYAGVTCTNNPAGPVGPEVTSTPQTVTPVSAIATGIAADYDIKPVNGSWSITPLGVSLTAGSYGPAAYDGSTHAPSACSSSAPSFVTCSNSPSPVGPDFGSGAVSPTPVYGKGSAADYSITPNNGSWSITALAVTVTGGSYGPAVYDGNSHALSACASTYAGVTCTNNPAGPVGPEVTSTPQTVTPVSAIATGIAADYDIKPVNGSWSITPLGVSLTAGSYGPAAYDGSTHAPSACSSSAPSFVTCSNSPSPVGPDFGSGAVSPTPVYGKGSAADYSITPNNGSWSITALAVTVTGGSYGPAVYDGNSHALSACASTYAGVTCTNNPAGPVGPEVTSTPQTVTPVSAIATGIAADYDIKPVNGSWSITPLGVSLTAGSYGPAAYDGSTHAPSACSSSAPSFVTCSNSPSPVGPDFGSGAVSPTPVYGKGSAADYSITPNNGSWSITALAVTVTGGSYSGVYDGSSHPLSACTSSSQSLVTCTNSPLGPIGPNVGGSAVNPTPVFVKGNAADYTITPAAGAWSITKANAAITVTPYSVAYNGAAHTATGTAKGVLNENLSGLSLSGTTHTNPGDYLTDPWTFADVTGNYNNAGGTVHDSIGYGACSVGAGGVILPPINSDGTSVYNRKGGSTIPVKFNVCGANGTPITDPMLVFAPTGGALTMTGALRGTITVVNEDGNTDIPDAAFTWDGQQWHFNMATMNLNSGYTYMFTINLAYAPASIHFVVGVK